MSMGIQEAIIEADYSRGFMLAVKLNDLSREILKEIFSEANNELKKIENDVKYAEYDATSGERMKYERDGEKIKEKLKNGRMNFGMTVNIPEKDEKILADIFKEHGIKYRFEKIDDQIKVYILAQDKNKVEKAFKSFIEKLNDLSREEKAQDKNKEKFKDVKSRHQEKFDKENSKQDKVKFKNQDLER